MKGYRVGMDEVDFVGGVVALGVMGWRRRRKEEQ